LQDGDNLASSNNNKVFHLKTDNMKKMMLVPMAVVLMAGLTVSNVNAQEKPKTAPKQEAKAAPAPAHAVKAENKDAAKKDAKPVQKQEVKHEQAK
jgi:hypothetical protein